MKTKKIVFLALALVIVLFIVILIITRTEKETEPDEKVSIYETSTHDERGLSIKESLVKMLGVPEAEIEVFIARESDEHINGIFFIKNKFDGSFLATVDESIDIVWAGEGAINCSAVHSYGFPREMAPHCF